MNYPRSYWEKLALLKSGVGAVGNSADTQFREFPSESCEELPVVGLSAQNSSSSGENTNSADNVADNQKTPEMTRGKLEMLCRQHVPTLPTPKSYELKFPQQSCEKLEFWVRDDVGNCRQLDIDTCATCRHWRPNPPVLNKITRKLVKDEFHCDRCHRKHPWHHCTQLFYVQKHTWGSPLEKGDVLTRDELRVYQVQNVDYLNTSPHFYCHMYEPREEAGDDAA